MGFFYVFKIVGVCGDVDKRVERVFNLYMLEVILVFLGWGFKKKEKIEEFEMLEDNIIIKIYGSVW